MACNGAQDPMEWKDLQSNEKGCTYCINIMVHQYIIVALESHAQGDVERLLLYNKVIRAKHRWQKRQLQWQEEEKYLGLNTFASDLWSCGEFHLEVKHAWGLRPISGSLFK
jgi:hypothetical protein